MYAPSTENLLISPSALDALHTFGKMWCLTLLPDLAIIEMLLSGKSYMEVLYLAVTLLDAGWDSDLEHQVVGTLVVIKF